MKKKCPNCKKEYTGVGASSRKTNKEICSDCGIIDAYTSLGYLKTGGLCYERAYHYLQNMPAEKQDMARLVHGIRHNVIDHANIDGHAWVEIDEIVIDPSLNPKKPHNKQRDEYYKKYAIREDELKRYTFAEAMELGFTLKHFGPYH